MIVFIDPWRYRLGGEAISRTLQFALSTYWSAKRRPPSKRSIRDEVIKVDIARVHVESFGGCRVCKVWAQFNREGIAVARCTMECLIRALRLRGATRCKPRRTTPSNDAAPVPRGLVDRGFTATALNCLWVADLTYMRAWSGFVYVAYVTDVYSRRIVGWQASRSLQIDMALHSMGQAVWERCRQGGTLDGLVHNSDRGVQYLSIRYTERPAECGVANSVESRCDLYDNALTEKMFGRYKTELVHNKGPCQGFDDLELATLEWVDWFNHHRLFGDLGHIPPAEFEDPHYCQHVPTEPVGTQTNQPA